MNYVMTYESYNNRDLFRYLKLKLKKKILRLQQNEDNLKEWLGNFFKETEKQNRRMKVFVISTVVLFASMTLTKEAIKMASQDASQDVQILVVNALDDLEKEEIPLVSQELEPVKELTKNPTEMVMSQDGWDEIRNEEKLRLKVYSIGDGMSTVGYGHAEPLSTSKYKVGQMITKEEADNLLKKDVNRTANGVRRIFSDWKKEGTDIKLNQHQFDVLVSMAYNMGVGGLRSSRVIQNIKQNKLNVAAELIKTTAVSKKFPGLAKRRMREYEKFIKKV